MWLVPPFFFGSLYMCSFQCFIYLFYLFFTFIFFHENVESCIYWYAFLEFVKEFCFALVDSYTIALETGYFLS